MTQENNKLKLELALKAAMVAHTVLGLLMIDGKAGAAATMKEVAYGMESIRQTIVKMPED